MNGIERQYLRECIQALCEARKSLLQLESEVAISPSDYGKGDSLCLDAYPELTILDSLCQDFDPYFVVITEEIGSNVTLRGSEEQFYCFCDPMDRSKFLHDFLKKKNESGILQDILCKENIKDEWENECGGDIEVSGPYGSITVVRKEEILFNVMINYITGVLYIACDEGVGSINFDDLFENSSKTLMIRTKYLLDKLVPISFEKDIDDNKQLNFVSYCKGKKYQDNIISSEIFPFNNFEKNEEKYLFYDSPGGPARILFLKDPPKVGFILSNGYL